MVKSSVTSVSTKPKRTRKSDLERQLAAMELEIEKREAATAASGGEKSDISAVTGPPAPTNAELLEAVVRCQWEHPEYGLKKIAGHLRCGGNGGKCMTVSDNRVKKFIPWPPAQDGALCYVGEVFPGSPAAAAGLLPGDILVKLEGQTGRGYVDVKTTIVPIITANIGKPLAATVHRRPDAGLIKAGNSKRGPMDGVLELKLTPAKWDGAGMLGCKLHDPVKSSIVEVKTIKPGDGKTFPKTGDTLSLHYTGCLASTGTKFDSSLDRGEPFSFKIGAGQVIRGWDVGVKKMSLGEEARLKIPSSMGYGAAGAGASIPPNADLVFVVELLTIN